ncbi:hypothetical protein JCM10908_000440 [Rhodotorula pacifica]|uniref:uncharacterized protein n=1 Tax=Rhodotorula pacifica TaxID=1495444 RepID=UPI00317433B5
MPSPRRKRTTAPTTALPKLCFAILLLAASTTSAASSSSLSSSSGLFRRFRGSQIAPGVSPAGPDYWCRVEGECLPCPPGARDSDLCRVYGNRRPLICVSKHTANNNNHENLAHISPPSSATFDLAGDNTSQHSNPNPNSQKPKGSKPLVPPAGSQAEADDFAREDEEMFGSGTVAGGIGTGAAEGGDQELEEELQAERLRVRRGVIGGRQGPISTWEACPKVLHSEHHDYFEFILCNAGFAAAAIAILVFRQRTLALQQFGRLAARIMQTQSSV